MMDQKTLAEIQKLKKDCIILAHNYQIPEIQDVADFVGDSLGLCQEAKKVNKPYILFCGVDFMAESAAILNPDKIVVMPELKAHCPMAAMLPAAQVREARETHPKAAVVLYINTLAEARAEADVTCTSANAIEIIKALNEEEIIFGPDKNLAWFVQQRCADKKIIPIPAHGHCRTHILIKREDILELRKKYPNAEVLIHPECTPDVQMLADYMCSTEQMVRRARESQSREFIIGTETGLLHRLKKENPNKTFISALKNMICPTMKMNTWEKFLKALRERKNVVRVAPEIAERARRATERMLELSK